MSTIVTDDGFARDDAPSGWVDLSPGDALPPGTEGITAIRIRFGSFADGRGFTLARQLRAEGFKGRLRAAGHLIPDQYAMARRSGFDEIEISDADAARLTEAQWRARADWRTHDYQSRLGRRP